MRKPFSIIAILGFVVYINSLGGEFIWDDIAFVKNNEFIKDWANAGKIFTKDAAKSLAPGGGAVRYNFYRPLQILTLMLDYSIWKLNTFGYHLTNIILHISAALAIFWLITILFGDRLLALLTACFFVVHPVHTEAVAFISGRADPLSLIFVLFTFIFYVKNQTTEGALFLFLAIASYVLAIFSRENSIILPGLLLLYHISFKRKIKFVPFASIAVIAVVYILFRMTMARQLLSTENVPSLAGAFQRIPGFFVAIINYFGILFLPIDLHMEYGNPLFTFMNPKAILGVVFSVLLIVYALRKRHQDNIIFFSILFFFIALIPSSNIYPIGAYMAEHWLYLPSLGFFLLLAKGILSLRLPSVYGAERRLRNSYLGIGVAGILLIFYSALTIEQNEYWRQLIPFYERTLKYNPRSPRLLNNLGVAYQDAGRYEKAIEAYRKSILIDPFYLETFCNLGTAYHDIGEYDKAIAAYKKEIKINPTYPKVYNNLGAAYDDIGRYEEAVKVYKKAIGLGGANQVELYFNLGLTYQRMMRYADAIAAYKKAIELNPHFANAYNDLAVAYHKAGRYEEARDAYKKAIALDPDNEEIYCNLGMASEALGRAEEAIHAYRKAIEINPNHAPSHNNLAILYFRKGQYALAVKHCDKALEGGYKVDARFLKDLTPHRK